MNSKSVRGGAIIAVLASCMAASTAAARNWNVVNGNWSVGTNWSPSGTPVSGEATNIVFTDGTARTVTYDFASPTLGLFAIDLTGAGTTTNTLSMPNNLSLTTSALLVGGYNGITSAQTSGRGAVTQSNGSMTIAASGDLVVGYGAGSTGTYTLSGTGAVTANQNELIGYIGTGTFTQSAGTNTINSSSVGSLDIGANSGANGTYNLSGTGTLSVNSPEYVGAGGTGNFIQTGGSNTISGSNHNLFLGYTATTGNGTYTLNSGTLTVNNANNEYVGYAATGSFNQSGGTNSVIGGYLILGQNAGSSGSYSLGGTGNLNANGELIGQSGTALFTQTGGTNTTSNLIIGDNSSPSSTYNLSGTGVLSASEGEIGFFGTNNQLNQNGGSNSVGGEFDVGGNAGSSGIYAISGGTGSLNTLFLGGDSTAAGGVGVLNVSGSGSLNIGPLTVYNTGSRINLSGGTLSAASINLNGVPSNLHWTGGALNITSNVTWDPSAAGTSTDSIFGSALTLSSTQTLAVTGNETLSGNGSPSAFSLTLNSGSSHTVSGTLTLAAFGTFTQNPGSFLNVATFTLAGGTVNGTLQNQGNFIYQSGLFNGRLLNQGTLNLGLNFTAGNGLENDTNMTVASGQTLSFNGVGLDNEGTFTLAGGTVNGAGPLSNSALLNGTGTLGGSGGFTNNAELSVSGGNITLSNSGANNNAGTIDISAGQLKLTGGNLANTGVVNLNGGIVSGTAAVNNTTGTINGYGTISSVFTTNAGLLAVDSGTLSIASAFANSGEVLLNGGVATLNSGTITNIGLIHGDGIISNTVNNNSGGEIRAEDGKRLKFSGSNGTNFGKINLQGGTLEFSHALTNGANTGQIEGRGTLIVGSTGLTNNGNIAFSAGISDVFGDVHNSAGSASQGITISGNANVTFWDDFTNGTSASDPTLFKVSSGSVVTFFGTYSGTGVTGTGSVYYEADVSPGFSPASVNYGGNVSLDSTSSLKIELAGTTVGSQYDKLNVAGQLSLDGALNVVLYNGFKPKAGNTFDIMDWSSLSGTFAGGVNLPTLGGRIVWDNSQLYTTGTLSVIATYYAGDFNRDGHVDASDVLAMERALANLSTYQFQKSLTDPEMLLVGDVNGDTKIDNADVQALLNLLQAGGGSTDPVPEPSALVLLAGSLLLGAIFLRRDVLHRQAI